MTRGMSCLAFLSLLLVGTYAQECTSVVDTATEAGLSILLEAVKAAGLVDTVNNPDAGLTIFAPTNEAFEAALAALGVTAADLLGNKELLTEILTYHVLPIPYKAADFGEGRDFTTLLGANSPCGAGDVSVKPSDEGVTIAGGASTAKVVTADVEACSTVIHVIDAVLLSCPFAAEEEPTPATIVEPVVEVAKEKPVEKKCTTVVETAQSAGLTTLLAAVTAAGLADTVNNPEAGLTIFAPTNEAFAKALKALDMTAEQLLADKDLLTTILTYHVLPTSYSARQLLGKKKVTTLLEEGTVCGSGDVAATELKVRRRWLFFGPVVVIGKGSHAKVVKGDVKACTTTIHVIDFVLLPCKRKCSSRTCKKGKSGWF
ncbi:hypothetical protein BSKO_08960 [Bryopsis sp. KO-2023]|nr:hypothetical protein BSKO_08960 [Bryopsis sp. KO-2023]